MMETKRQKISHWISAALALTTILVFAQVVTFDFTTYDDPDFITANPIVKAGLTAKGFQWVWRSEVARNWHPVTMLSHMVDCQLFGTQPWWPHLVNVLLHAANVALLFHLLKRMTGTIWRSAMVAALFALHPLHVESVAWIAERKDVLSTLFWFLATLAYLRYAENPKAKFYILTLVLFAIGLMCKPMLVTVPFALLLLDYWPLGRAKKVPFWRLVLEKVPFMLLSAAVCVITYSIQQHWRLGADNQQLADEFSRRQCIRFVCSLHRQNVLAAPSCGAIPALRQLDWVGSGTRRSVPRRPFRRRNLAIPQPSVADRGLVLVRRHTRARDWDRPGRNANNGGPLYLRPAHPDYLLSWRGAGGIAGMR